MLDARPAGWFTWDYNVLREGERIATLKIAWSRESGSFTLGGRRFDIRREGFMGWVGAFRLSTEEEVLCQVRRPNPLSRRYAIDFVSAAEEAPLILEAASIFGRKFIVRCEGKAVGEIRPAGFFSRKAIVELPDSVALPMQVLLLWLTLINWRRQAHNNNS